ncbi:hypothetical protein ACFVGY_15620 [Streptomyces sp. NPDC127106]|uniref:hypothetical protein n=1 Tax=Streptomyces sp. NPDC127106 TaxID=3345360 RepID=UPI00362D498A
MSGSMRDKRQRPGIGREEQTREVPAERTERTERTEETRAGGPQPEGPPDRAAQPRAGRSGSRRGDAAEQRPRRS